jgi:hypothetical protein
MQISITAVDSTASVVGASLRKPTYYPPHTNPERDCVQFITARSGSYYVTIPKGTVIPIGMTYAEAIAWTANGTVTFDYQPTNWTVRATFREGRPRCVAVTHPERGIAYWRFNGASIPTSLADLRGRRVGQPQWQPCGEVLATFEVPDEQ